MSTKQSAISSQQSALDALRKKTKGLDDVEMSILFANDPQKYDRNYINSHLAAEQYARLRTRNEQLEAIARRVVELEDEDGGRSFPPRELIADARRLLADEQPADAGRYEKGG